MSKLILETNPNVLVHIDPHPRISITPAISPDFWHFRVKLSDKQALLAFPKFHTIGIGFEQEKDWNTNLPYLCPAEEIYQHIKHNKADKRITKKKCIEAIEALRRAAAKALGKELDKEVVEYLIRRGR